MAFLSRAHHGLDRGREQALRRRFLDVRPMPMTIADAMTYYNDIVDESDPDMEHEPQLLHAIQCAMGAKASGLPEWGIVIGFIHDVGKLLVYDYLLNDRDREWMPILWAFRDHIDLYTKHGETEELDRHLPEIWDVVHRYIRPDYRFNW
jgi:hypothetical protein